MTSVVHSQWVPLVAVSGIALRVPETPPECVHVIFKRIPSYCFVQGERFVGAISSMKARAPVTGGNFGVWGGMFSTFDCAVKGWRQKEDAWNAIISGFMTGGCLAARSTLLFRLSFTVTNRSLFLILRWSKICFRLCHSMWYPSWRVRGSWCSCITSI